MLVRDCRIYILVHLTMGDFVVFEIFITYSIVIHNYLYLYEIT